MRDARVGTSGLIRWTDRLTEITLIGTLAWSVWPFGSVHPYFEWIIAYPLAVILALWSLRMLLAGRPLGFDLPAAGQLMANGLLGLFLVAALQLLTLPPGVLQTLSPNVTPLIEQLVPQPREILASADSPIAAPDAGIVGRSISLNPGGSYQFAIRLLVLSAFFLAVSSLRGPLETLRRLAVAMTVVGAALALFSLLQRLTGGADTIYGYYTFPTSGEGTFGPFINRNHYPFFANLCLGLALGLLFERRERVGRSWYDVLHDTLSLWLLVGIGLIVASLFVCVSRGGVVALFVGGLVALTARLQRGRKLQAFGALIGLVGAAGLVLIWIGFNVLESRLGLLFEAERYGGDGRWYIWQSALPSVWQFPLFGTGGETFQHISTIHSVMLAGWSDGYVSTRADNEFLDVLVEFGFAGLLALVLLTAAALYHGFTLARERPLAAGCLMGLVAVVVHSCVDFGLRVPASALLATTVAALLAAVRLPTLPVDHYPSRDPKTHPSNLPKPSDKAASSANSLLLLVPRWLVTLLLSGAVVGVAASLVLEKRRSSIADAWRLDGFLALSQGDYVRVRSSLARAQSATPEDVNLYIDAGYCLLAAADRTADPGERSELLDLAVESAVKARDLCPIAWEPPLWLAENADQLSTGQSSLDYVLTAQRLNPTNPEINFTAGALLYASGRYDEAWPHWHDHLVVTPRRLPRILELARQQLTVDEVISRVLPANLQLLSAAAAISQRAGQAADRQRYLGAVVRLAEEKMAVGSADQREAMRDPELASLLGRAFRELGEPAAAIEAFQRAVRYSPTQVDWRVELAQLLLESSQIDEARRQVRTALDLEPEHRIAQQLRLEIARQQAEQQARAASRK
jgi:tetratricopeptide (TPR) repeat protein